MTLVSYPILGCIALIISLLGYGLFVKNLLKIEFAHSIVFSFSIILSAYYLAAFTKVLDNIIYLSFFLGLMFFIYVIFNFFKNNKAKNILEIFTGDVIVFSINVFIYFIKINKYIIYNKR